MVYGYNTYIGNTQIDKNIYIFFLYPRRVRVLIFLRLPCPCLVSVSVSVFHRPMVSKPGECGWKLRFPFFSIPNVKDFKGQDGQQIL